MPANTLAYGTLQFPDVLRVLLGRVPAAEPATVAGWRAAALAGRSYPGLLRAAATVSRLILAGLTASEIQVVDAFESGPYDLRRLIMADGRQAWTYVWTDPSAVLPHAWSKEQFAAEQSHAFLLYCRDCRDWRGGCESSDRIPRRSVPSG